MTPNCLTKFLLQSPTFKNFYYLSPASPSPAQSLLSYNCPLCPSKWIIFPFSSFIFKIFFILLSCHGKPCLPALHYRNPIYFSKVSSDDISSLMLLLPLFKRISPFLDSFSTQSFYGPYHKFHFIIVIFVHIFLAFVMSFESSNDFKTFSYTHYI